MSKFSIRVLHVARFSKALHLQNGFEVNAEDLRDLVEAAAASVMEAGWVQ